MLSLDESSLSPTTFSGGARRGTVCVLSCTQGLTSYRAFLRVVVLAAAAAAVLFILTLKHTYACRLPFPCRQSPTL